MSWKQSDRGEHASGALRSGGGRHGTFVPRIKTLIALICAAVMTFGMANGAPDMKEPVLAAENDGADMAVRFAMEYYGSGWSSWSPDNRRIYHRTTYPTAFKAALENQPAGTTGTIQYEVNVSGSGWTGTFENGAVAGVEGGDMPLEGLRVWLNGSLADQYDVYTKVMVNGAWMDWVTNGADAGQIGVGTHIDGARIAVVKKGETPADIPETSDYAVDPSRPMVALTFDDGPSAYDAQILTALEAVGGRATFFMVGSRVGSHADVVQRMAADGCELGNHSWNHENFSKLSSASIQASVQKANDAIQSVAGQTATIVRPPYGATGGNCKSTLAAMGYPAILWHIDTLDWKTKNADNTVNVILSQVQNGDIILMHSIYAQSASAAERVIPALVERGYQLVTVSELANVHGGMVPGKAYGAFR